MIEYEQHYFGRADRATQVKLESKFARLLIAIAVLEGVGRSLDADCNILQASLPVVLEATKMASSAAV